MFALSSMRLSMVRALYTPSLSIPEGHASRRFASVLMSIAARQVALKMAYNDAGQARGLLSGRLWYNQQAFR